MSTSSSERQGGAVDLLEEVPAAPLPPAAALLLAQCPQCPPSFTLVLNLADGRPPQCIGAALAEVPGLAPGPFDPVTLATRLHPADAQLVADASAWAAEFVQQHAHVAPGVQFTCSFRLCGSGPRYVPVLRSMPLALLRTPAGPGPWVCYFQRLGPAWPVSGVGFSLDDKRFWPWLRKRLKLTPWPVLTPREREALRLLLDGLTNAEVAAAMHIQHCTMLTHRRNLLHKAPAGHLAALRWQLGE